MVTGLNASATQPGHVLVNGTNNNEIYAYHPGGADVTFADGHVGFLRDSVAARTVVALITCRAEDVSGDY